MLCADSSIFYESLALVMLVALYALAVEICAEAPGRVSSLKTRPGASCGVLLGAITLPAVLASKLIQQSRGYLLREIELEAHIDLSLRLLFFVCQDLQKIDITSSYKSSVFIQYSALAVFLVLEIIRIWRMWPLGQLVHQFMTAFTDHRDSDILIVRHQWLATKKTIEGTAAGITSMMAACLTLLPLLASTGYLVTENWFPLLFAATVSGLLEAYTAQLDNAFIPLSILQPPLPMRRIESANIQLVTI
ncbi:hypothetical protein QQ045_012786 [Rhodiola kirilowii]